MDFHTPSWVPHISIPIPDDKLAGDFVIERNHNLCEWSDDKPTVMCALSGKSYTMNDIKNRVLNLSKCLSKRLGWFPNEDSAWNKVVGILSYNTVSGLTYHFDPYIKDENDTNWAPENMRPTNAVIERLPDRMLGSPQTRRNMPSSSFYKLSV